MATKHDDGSVTFTAEEVRALKGAVQFLGLHLEHPDYVGVMTGDKRIQAREFNAAQFAMMQAGEFRRASDIPGAAAAPKRAA